MTMLGVNLWFVIGEAFYLHRLVHFLRQMGLAEGQASFGEPFVMSDENLRLYQTFLTDAEGPIAALQLITSLNAVRDFSRRIERRFTMGFEIDSQEIKERAFQCFKVIQWESERVICVRLSDRVSKLSDLDKMVEDRFPGARTELVEAEECLYYERPTACAFHSMRAVEYVVRSAWKSLGLSEFKRQEGWGALLKPMDEQLQKPPRNPHALWSDNIQFFSELVMDLRAAKRGCRDSTMHVESNYDLKAANAILDTTITLVTFAATHLDQDGAFSK